MTTFYRASNGEQTLFLISVFLLELLVAAAVFAAHGQRKIRWLRDGNYFLFLLLFLLLLHYKKAFDGINSGILYSAGILLPMWLLWCMVVFFFLLLLGELFFLYRQSKRRLGPNSVKQALDRLPEAVCYFTPSGAVKLCNLQMYRLFRSLAQTDLQGEAELTEALQDCDERSGVICLSKERQTYLFPDGRVWRYVQHQVTARDGVAYTEALFFDVTDLHDKNLVLKEQTKELKKIAREIKELSDHVLTVTKEREILNYKTRLHSQMGAGLTAIRQSLLLGRDDKEILSSIQLLSRAISLFHNDNENLPEKSEWAELVRDARVIGVEVSLRGKLPGEGEALRLSLMAVRECLTNAVRHGNATRLQVDIQEQDKETVLSITNDGKPPEGEILPGGGLDNLRRQLRTVGGYFVIQSAPVFKLTVTIPI